MGSDNVVGEQAEEAPVAHRLGRLENGVTEPEGLFLNHHPDLDILQTGKSPFHEEVLLDEMTGVEIDHDEDLTGPGPGRLFHDVLNRGSVDDRQEAFGHHPGGGAHPGPSTGGRNYSN